MLDHGLITSNAAGTHPRLPSRSCTSIHSIWLTIWRWYRINTGVPSGSQPTISPAGCWRRYTPLLPELVMYPSAGVGVGVSVWVGVSVGVGDWVGVDVGVLLGAAVRVAVGVNVSVGVGPGVAVGVNVADERIKQCGGDDNRLQCHRLLQICCQCLLQIDHLRIGWVVKCSHRGINLQDAVAVGVDIQFNQLGVRQPGNLHLNCLTDFLLQLRLAHHIQGQYHQRDGYNQHEHGGDEHTARNVVPALVRMCEGLKPRKAKTRMLANEIATRLVRNSSKAPI